MSILDESVESLYDTIREDLSEPIVYGRGDDRCELLAFPSKPEELVDGGTVMTAHDDLDWTFCAEDLILAGSVTPPQPGDTIQRLRHAPGAAVYFEVRPIAGQQCFKRNDPLGTILTAHTKRMADPDPEPDTDE
mgnify:CR=1 FL=1